MIGSAPLASTPIAGALAQNAGAPPGDMAGTCSLSFSATATADQPPQPYTFFPQPLRPVFATGVYRSDPYYTRPVPFVRPNAAPTGEIFGTVSFAFTASGTLDGIVSAPPWQQLYKPPRRVWRSNFRMVYYDRVVFVPFTVSESLAGTTSLTFTPTATLSGGGALAGTSALAFTTSATLTGAGALAGTSALTFTTSATLLGGGALAGTTALTFAPSATLGGAGALAGTTSLTFTTSADLQGAAPGEMLAQASLAFTGSATLTASGALAGVSALAFAPSGTLEASGLLAGATSLTFALTADLGELPAGELAGVASFAFTTSGTLSGGALAPPITGGGPSRFDDALYAAIKKRRKPKIKQIAGVAEFGFSLTGTLTNAAVRDPERERRVDTFIKAAAVTPVPAEEPAVAVLKSRKRRNLKKIAALVAMLD